MSAQTATLAELESRAEVLKLARLLKTPAERLDFLEQVDAVDIRRLREQATDVLFDANLGVLQRMAAASKLLPVSVLGRIAEKVFGPLLCARLAGLIDVSRGVDVARRLSPAFLSDVAAELDPRRARRIIAGIPADTVREVAHELVGRQDWITIGRFVGHLPDRTVSATLDAVHDEALLRVAFVLDEKERIDHVVDLLPSTRFPGLAAAAAEHDLWPLAFDLLTHLRPANQERLISAVAGLESGVRADARKQAAALGLLDEAGPVRTALA
ncbi:hypothetical protein SAMN05216266_12852 [Amycolatopsis marina]|uniref:DUF2336 domain-containing protein n=1 Tax=Amycolatopsis marina TaxID=490629 RepID=A0A1I1CG56_9PSEU|nr:hypothetical protein [Amycolatopsis marina]SFB61619.1 hypothetical protein SAMN05216266_12852 [Amycolatopsis marina]